MTHSPFEDILLHCDHGDRRPVRIAIEILRKVEAVGDLLALRLVSSIVKRMVDWHSTVLNTTYIASPPQDVENIRGLARIAPYCQHIFIKIDGERDFPCTTMQNARPSCSDNVDRPTMDDTSWLNNDSLPPGLDIVGARPPVEGNGFDENLLERWLVVFSLYPSVSTLTITCKTNYEPASPCIHDIKSKLVTLRIAIERARFPRLVSLRLAPIPLLGIVYMRWGGGGAYAEANALSGRVWQGLRSLELQVFTEQSIAPSQSSVIRRVTRDYVESFRYTLSCLKFAWIEEQGPNPMLICTGDTHEPDPAITQWSSLTTLWVSRCEIDYEGVQWTQERAPNLKEFWIADEHTSTGTDGLTHFDQQHAWSVVPLGESTMDTKAASPGLGSQPESQTAPFSRSAVSSTSMMIPIVLDI